uniref:Uncharacterized protein n=1 Tax=Magallana gigas TaxID=29159 RepID=K1QD43_MAGGI
MTACFRRGLKLLNSYRMTSFLVHHLHSDFPSSGDTSTHAMRVKCDEHQMEFSAPID